MIALCPKLLLGATGSVVLFLAAAACSSSKKTNPTPATVPNFRSARFTSPTDVDHPFFPLQPGNVQLYHADTADGPETIVVEVLPDSRLVNGVPCVVIRDQVFQEGLLIEDTHDWYAQDDAGNVWYMGEEVDNYEYDPDGNVLAITHEGAWEAGRDVAGVGVVAQPGHRMPANPLRGLSFHQEFYRGQAEDAGEVVALDVPITLADGTTELCLQVLDTSALIPGAAENKFFARGIGSVREEDAGSSDLVQLVGRLRPGPAAVPAFNAATFSDPTTIDNPHVPLVVAVVHAYLAETEDGVETILVERIDAAKSVLGIACAVVRDRVFLDDLLIEDTRDWYAQDDAGNVWYMGEEVDNYEYDEQGVLLEVNHEGSWEAGLDVAGVGAIAQPGYQMPAAPSAGAFYHQEFYGGEAEDIAQVVALGVEVELEDGRSFDNCVRTLDWNPLAPDGLEYKFYRPGIGLVAERALHVAEEVGLQGRFDTAVAAVPDFAAATFSDPSRVDHPLFPLPAGGGWCYEKPTEEGLETITVEVLPMIRTVLGIDCAVVRDRVFLDGVLIEDTHDWYAQDDAGNVWYMGEEVDNYNYDPNGVLLSVTHEGAWEAGLDVAMVGFIARPGFQMLAVRAADTSYYQEYYETAAEDMGAIVAIDVTVEVDGVEYTGCVQVLDWNPLDPAVLEHKFFAPGIGLVLERDLISDEESRLTMTTLP